MFFSRGEKIIFDPSPRMLNMPVPGSHELHDGQEEEGEEEGRPQPHGQGQGHQVEVQGHRRSPVPEDLGKDVQEENHIISGISAKDAAARRWNIWFSFNKTKLKYL